MKILFVITHYNFFAPIEPVARELHKKGHQVSVLINPRANKKFESRYPFKHETHPYYLGWASSRNDVFQFLLYPLRELISYIAYLKYHQPTSPLLIERWAGFILPFFLRRPTQKFLQYLARTERGKKLLRHDSLWNFLRKIERITPLSNKIEQYLKQEKPDIVVAASAIMPYSRETDYLKTAKKLGIPTILVVPSWDNLTTKGIIHVIPDWMFVWNQGQITEATDLHFMPKDQIFCTGAPKFDLWFKTKPILSRSAFSKQVGLNPQQPFILYVCSSEFIANNETEFVEEFALNLQEHPSLREVRILVRPHPQNLKAWHKKPHNNNIVVWSEDMQKMDVGANIQGFYHSIFYSICVVGINTSAFIEAAIVDKPCVAITSDNYNYTQLGIPHFHHLVDANFLEMHKNTSQLLATLENIMNGQDTKIENRHNFVKNFVRPHGLDIRSSDVMLLGIENIANNKHPNDTILRN